jgi:hypothetical protein
MGEDVRKTLTIIRTPYRESLANTNAGIFNSMLGEALRVMKPYPNAQREYNSSEFEIDPILIPAAYAIV